MTLYFPDAAESVPPVAERCPDPSHPTGRCAFSETCSHQWMQQRIAKWTQAPSVVGLCPWIDGMRSAKACEPESA